VKLINLTIDEFRRLAALVYEKTGIHLEERKLGLLSNRLRKRLAALRMDTFEQYYQYVHSKSGFDEEQPEFLSAVTTNETYFLRNDALWKYFSDEIIPGFIAAKGGGSRTLRIWSAAGSSGEEAYTAAILLREALPDFANWNVTIIGSDISERVLTTARAGVYNDYAVSRMSPARIGRWFDKINGHYQLKHEIRRMVRFMFHNLRDPFPGGRFDLVFLRNVLMYFDLPMKKRVIDVVSDALWAGGLLIVGDVDPIGAIPELCGHVKLKCRRQGIYQKPQPGRVECKI
jgi:chemotaxis protein methyltransferase CheR